MVSSIISEPGSLIQQWSPLIEAIINVTAVIFVLALIIFLYVVFLRIRNTMRQKYRARFKQQWRKVIFDWMSGEKTEPAKLGRGDQLLLMELWHNMRRLLDDESSAELNEFAAAAGLDDTAAHILQYRSYHAENRKIWLQLMAVRTARYVHTDTAVQALLRASDSSNFSVNIAATCALVELDHERADLCVLSSLMQFRQWVPYIVARVSLVGGSDLLHLIGEQMDSMDAEQARNLISLIDATSDRSLLPMLVEIMQGSEDMQEQASILKTLGRLGDHGHVKYITPYLGHEDWVLRLRAVAALGRLGDSEDLIRILPLTSDKHWWVRYRAAESYLLIARPGTDGFRQLIDTLTDQTAKEMFNHVHAEMSYA